MPFTLSLSFSHFLMLVFFLMLFVTTLYSYVLIYHWRVYGESSVITIHTIILYLVGVVFLFGGMATAIGMTL